jgi:hypothetical protein
MKRFFVPLFTAVLLFTSCTIAHQENIRSDVPLDYKVIKQNYGTASGSDKGFSILFWMFNRPDMQDALADAKHAYNADALTNISFTEKYYFFFLFSITTLTVQGEAVSLEDAEKTTEVKK